MKKTKDLSYSFHQENENSLRFILQLPTKKRGILHVHLTISEEKFHQINEISEDESEPEEGDSPAEEADTLPVVIKMN